MSIVQGESRFYTELADWWPLFSPYVHYYEEIPDAMRLLRKAPDAPPKTLLELGAGGGSLSWHLKHEFQCTLSDVSPGMAAVCRSVNPECEVLLGDMRTLRLGRTFDVVLIHDAIGYMTSEADLRAAMATAAIHARPGGGVVILPDHTTENFAPSSEHGGEDGEDGRGFRYLEWTQTPNGGDTYETYYSFMMREADGSMRVELDRHRLGLFPLKSWLQWMDDAGITTSSEDDSFNRTVFFGRKR